MRIVLFVVFLFHFTVKDPVIVPLADCAVGTGFFCALCFVRPFQVRAGDSGKLIPTDRAKTHQHTVNGAKLLQKDQRFMRQTGNIIQRDMGRQR